MNFTNLTKNMICVLFTEYDMVIVENLHFVFIYAHAAPESSFIA